MKAYWATNTGTAIELEQRETPAPKPAAGQILVKMHAATLNRGAFIVRGHAIKGPPVAQLAGNEGAGEVAALGEGVTNFAVGDRVMGVCGAAFAEFAVMDSRMATLVPKTLSWEEAACTTMVFTVVHDMLMARGHLKAGEWLLVTAASSGVGVAAIQLAKALGAHTIGTSGSQAKLDKLKAVGLDVGVATRGPEFLEETMKATGGKGANLIINNVGGTIFSECLKSLAFEGRLAEIGHMDGVYESTIDLSRLHANRLTVFGTSAQLRTAEHRIAAARGFARDVLPLIAAGRIKPLVDRVFSFADLPAAKAHMEANAHVGKIAVTIP